jgi:hypothetical protein
MNIYKRVKDINSLMGIIERRNDRLEEAEACPSYKEWTSIEEDCCGMFQAQQEEIQNEIKSIENEIEGMMK